jgi:hypothetical protein
MEVQIGFAVVSSIGWVFHDEFYAVLVSCRKESERAHSYLVRAFELSGLSWR